MKRLVICCDGTWNRPDNAHVTNIEKIARTVETDPVDGDPPAQQMVLYLSGVGTSGYTVDRLLGGAFGFGLFDNMRSGYRFLALNYDPGDEIFVFGFSRGAYTARSLVGMIGRVGLLTRESLIRDQPAGGGRPLPAPAPGPALASTAPATCGSSRCTPTRTSRSPSWGSSTRSAPWASRAPSAAATSSTT